MIKKYYENTKNGHSKFWSVCTTANVMYTTYGKIGTPGTTIVKEFRNAALAETSAMTKIAEKIRKGYVQPTSKRRSSTQWKTVHESTWGGTYLKRWSHKPTNPEIRQWLNETLGSFNTYGGLTILEREG